MIEKERSNNRTRESAVIVGVVHPRDSKSAVDDSLDELALLTDTAGADVTDRVTQVLPGPNPATYIGSGKVGEVGALVSRRDSDLVVFDDDLSPVQIRNLEREIGCKIVDRSALILDIFAGRAKTATAKAQVEMAQLDYLRTRLTRQWTHLSRQKGGIGTKGPGETQIETDRRLIGARIATLRKRLEKIDQQRKTQRRGRSKFTRVSLVGYTNAGKSTLMNALAGTEVHTEDRLFATLDATTRLASLASNKQILLSDTVGFIRKLPHRLIESFKSTLDEVRESDALLHVVDSTHEQFDHHMEVVRRTLKELNAGEKPVLVVFNKIDDLVDRGIIDGLKHRFQEAVFVSALRGIGLTTLKARTLDLIEADFEEVVAYIPVERSKLIAHIHNVADVIEEDFVMARDRSNSASELTAARIRFRTARSQYEDLAPVLERFSQIRPL